MNYIFGFKSLKEAINNNNIHIKNVYVTKQKQDVIDFVKSKNIKFQIVNDHSFFNKWDSTLNHQYCVSEIESNNFFSDIKEFLNSKYNKPNDKQLILILDQLNDPRNFGSIIRTAYALGVSCIVYKKNNQVQINELVIKTSLASCYFIPMVKTANLTNCINVLKDNGYWIYCSTLSNQSINYNDIEYDNKSVLIIGSEAKGISKQVEKNSDYHIKIPMKNNYDSLNASVATGILISKILN